MNQMYKARRYVKFYDDVHPEERMYVVPSYHDGMFVNTAGTSSATEDESESSVITVISLSSTSCDSFTGDDSADRLELSHQELIEEIEAFIVLLDDTLAKSEEYLRKISSGQLSLKSPSSNDPETAHEAKQGAQNEKEHFAYKKSEEDASYKEKLENFGTNCPPALTTFPPTDCPKEITVIGEDACAIYMVHLAKIGARFSVTFEGMSEKIGASRCTVKLQKYKCSRNMVAEFNGVVVSGRVAIWKLLGALVNVYPTSAEHADICTHIDFWLSLIDDVMSGRVEKDDLYRRMSGDLSRHDYLVPKTAATLADILAYSIVKKGIYHANNLELWLKRMDELLN